MLGYHNYYLNEPYEGISKNQLRKRKGASVYCSKCGRTDKTLYKVTKNVYMCEECKEWLYDNGL